MTESPDEFVARLRAEGWRILPPPPPKPPRSCIVCGRTEDAYLDAPYWTEVKVALAPGEEGHAFFDTWICDNPEPHAREDDCLARVQEAFMSVGFKDHRHGGINYLEDEDCPGVQDPSACPTPVTDDEDY